MPGSSKVRGPRAVLPFILELPETATHVARGPSQLLYPKFLTPRKGAMARLHSHVRLSLLDHFVQVLVDPHWMEVHHVGVVHEDVLVAGIVHAAQTHPTPLLPGSRHGGHEVLVTGDQN